MSRTPPPPLPGGYTIGEKLYHIGPSQTLDDGDRLVHGEHGEVTGPRKGEWKDGWRSSSRTTRSTSRARSNHLSRSPPPPLPGGYKVGEKLYIAESETSTSGNHLVHGEQGEVIGPSSTSKDGKLALKFTNNKGPVAIELNELSRSPPLPLPGGYKLGEMLYYIAESETFDDGDRLVHGEQGEVVGPGIGDLEGRLDIKFPNNKGNVNCTLDALSRSPPQPLPGGYKVGEKLYYTGASETFDDGDRLVHGEQGEVTGPYDRQWEGRLAMKFPDNKSMIACTLDALSRSPPPPLPGGYKVGEKLYFVGSSQTFDDGDRLVHGEQGEVMGPSTSKDNWTGWRCYSSTTRTPSTARSSTCHARRRRRCLAAILSARRCFVPDYVPEYARRTMTAATSWAAIEARWLDLRMIIDCVGCRSSFPTAKAPLRSY